MIVQNLNAIQVEKTPFHLTSFAGLPLFLGLANRLNLPSQLNKISGLKVRQRGYSASDQVLSLMTTLIAGGRNLGDVELLRQDPGIGTLFENSLFPAPNILGNFLRQFDQSSIWKLGQINSELIRKLITRGTEVFMIAETVHAPFDSKNLPAFRLIVTRRIKSQLELFKSPIKDLATLSNLPAEFSTDEVFNFYNKRGAAEKDIGELKNGFGLSKLPCKEFMADAAYLQINLLAHTLSAKLLKYSVCLPIGFLLTSPLCVLDFWDKPQSWFAMPENICLNSLSPTVISLCLNKLADLSLLLSLPVDCYLLPFIL